MTAAQRIGNGVLVIIALAISIITLCVSLPESQAASAGLQVAEQERKDAGRSKEKKKKSTTPTPEPHPSKKDTGTENPADNTGKNVRDKSGETLTPMDQSNDTRDLEMTQQIRKALMDDDSLSTNAKNIKVITVNGTVTLRGPVNSVEERNKIAAKAKPIAGGKLKNELEIPSSK